MFELNEALACWRRAMIRGGVRRRDVLDELEAHLVEEFNCLVSQGQSPERAFTQAAAGIGDPRAINAEFKKIRSGRNPLLALIEGGMMDDRRDRLVAARVLSVMFSSSLWIALIALLCMLAMSGGNGVKPYPSTLPPPYGIYFGAISFVLFMVAWALKFRWKRPKFSGMPRWFEMTIIVPLVLFYLAVAAIAAFGWGPRLVSSPKLVQSAKSPDGKFEAYVLDLPSIDPPNQQLYLRRVGEKFGHEVGGLGVSRLEKIVWAPDGSLVVFQSSILVVARPGDFKSKTLSMGLNEAWRGGTFAIDSSRKRFLTGIEFPSPGVLVYHYKLAPTGAIQSETVDLN